MLRSNSASVRGGTCVVANSPRGVTVGGQPLDTFTLHAAFRVPGLHGSPVADVADHVRLALEQLHAHAPFNRVEFPVTGGLGFRAIQAKRAGLAFDSVTLAVRLDSCGEWHRQQQHRWPESYEEIETDFAERWAFEYADERLTPDETLLAFVQRLGWDDVGLVANTEPGGREPLVTIGIAHYNLGRYLPETLASLAAQTYANLEVIVIDDGSTDAASVRVFDEMESRYPQWRFFRQANAGIGTTRNRCLELARGDFFIPVDADNLARPEMVTCFVTAIRRNPHLAAMTCYFLAFEDGTGNPPQEFLHALRPAGGPHILSCIRNVYGDANAVFRTGAFREVGGYETDRGTSCEDWEAFVKLVHAGQRIGVVPCHLFYYRHLPGGFSRRTNWFDNHQRVLRQFNKLAALPSGEGASLWTAFLGLHQKLEQVKNTPKPLRYRIADSIDFPIRRMFRAARFLKRRLFTRGTSRVGSA